VQSTAGKIDSVSEMTDLSAESNIKFSSVARSCLDSFQVIVSACKLNEDGLITTHRRCRKLSTDVLATFYGDAGLVSCDVNNA